MGIHATVMLAPGDTQALEEQRNGEWRYLEFLQVTRWITADIFMREMGASDRLCK